VGHSDNRITEKPVSSISKGTDVLGVWEVVSPVLAPGTGVVKTAPDPKNTCPFLLSVLLLGVES